MASFRSLHERQEAFVIPNPWDVGTARVLASLGFEALATTSAGLAFSLGVPEGILSRDQVLDHCQELVDATALPVTADLEAGFGDDAETVFETITLAAEAGLAGGSIEDYSGNADNPIYEFEHTVERIQAAVEAARALPNDFVLTARCENFLHGRLDLDDTIKRLQAFETAGADVLYAPGLQTLADIRTVCASVSKPVNVVMGMPGATYGVSELSNAGVKRISVGSAFSRLAFGSLMSAAQEILKEGTFSFANNAAGFNQLDSIFAKHQE